MQIHDSVLDLIGGTPLVRLDRTAAGLPATVVAKLEYLNPGGSVKDRIALRMVESAEAEGLLRRGGTIVEPTSGNTGVGLAMVAQRKGYRTVFTCPDKVSADKIAVLRAYGAEVVVCPAAVPPDHPDSYRSVAQRLAAEIPGAFRPDQYSNAANPASHYASTGPELWTQTAGRLTHFVAGVGTGGTITGTGRYLKEVSDGRVMVVGADPEGSVYSGGDARPYIVEGVGQPSFPPAYDPLVPDRVIAVSDMDAVRYTRRLALEEGLLTGGSGGMAVAAALEVAASARPSDLVVVLLPDSGRGYLSKIFNDAWVQQYGFENEPGSGPRVGDALNGAALLTVAPDDSLADAVELMRKTGATRLPVTAASAPVRLAEIIGRLDETALAQRIAAGDADPADRVAAHMSAPLPVVGTGQLLTGALEAVTREGAALVVDGGLPCGVITLRDVVDLLDRTSFRSHPDPTPLHRRP